MSKGDDADDPHVGFLYKAMLSRDPQKRKVKPVQKHLMTLAFGNLDDSEDDEDFHVPENQDSDDDSDINTSAEDEEEDNDDDDDEDVESTAASDKEASVSEVVPKATLDETSCLSIDTKSSTVEGTVDASLPLVHQKIKLCSVCLDDTGREDDEVIECDSCGLAVHEGCHGICDNQSEISTDSSASTEPWFCDACKAGVTPHCELCPNMGGIFKETDAGKWVHLVCALYIPGVAFGDVEKLRCVTLHEMPMSKWGAKACSLCDDALLSRTGICISCDAGMCRNFFHVTCAQKEGLLSEGSHNDEVADPFFAHCKQHTDKTHMKAKRRNYLTVQSNVKAFESGHEAGVESKARITRKLALQRHKYEQTREKNFSFWYPNTKIPHFLTSSARAVKRLRHKAQLLGIGDGSGNDISERSHPKAVQQEVQKKWHIPPAFSMEFVAYYVDRGKRVDKMRQHKQQLLTQHSQLQAEEKRLLAVLNKLQGESSGLNMITDSLKANVQSLWAAINTFSNKKLKEPAVLDLVKPSSPASEGSAATTSKQEPAVLNMCAFCKGTNDQHKLVFCDTCEQYYHFGCLDPPLTRLPKKSKLFSWQCSNCAPSSSDESGESTVDTQAPMRLRENIKLPQKFINEIEIPKDNKKADRKRGRTKPAAKTKSMKAGDDDEEEEEEPVVKKPKQKVSTSPSKVKNKLNICPECDKTCTATACLKCVQCDRSWHKSCVGYSPREKTVITDWFCPECSTSSDEQSIIDGTVDEHVDDAPYFVIDD